MLLVKNYLDKSGIHGLGVFAAEPIQKGTWVWTFKQGVDQLIDAKWALEQPPIAREYLDRYTYENPKFPGKWILECDNGRFMNHSNHPSVLLEVAEDGNEYLVAVRDIAQDEEITCDYRDCCGDFTSSYL